MQDLFTLLLQIYSQIRRTGESFAAMADYIGPEGCFISEVIV